jgi:hypothetical protein
MAGKITVSTINDSSGVLATQNGMTGIAKAWLQYNGTTQTVVGSFNVSSVTYNATGKYTLNFTTAMPNANYAVSCTSSNTNGGSYTGTGSLFYASTSAAGALTTTTCAVAFTGNNGLSTYENPFTACVIVFSS